MISDNSFDMDDINIDMNNLGNDYLRLIGATQSDLKKSPENNTYRWTGVISTAYFQFNGCKENMLADDIEDAWAHIESAHQYGLPPWEFKFYAKDFELPNSTVDTKQFELSNDELEELGKKVTRLRQ